MHSWTLEQGRCQTDGLQEKFAKVIWFTTSELEFEISFYLTH